MTVSHMLSQTGLGVSSSIGDFRWNGHSFNPSPEDPAYQSWDPYTESWAGFHMLGPTSSFSLTGFRYGNEVMVEGLQWSSSTADNGTAYMDWYDPDNNLLFSTSWDWSHPGGGYWSASWSGIGMKASTAQEIWKNGTYTVAWEVTGQYNTISGYDYPVISNYGTQTLTYDPGHLWVEGTLLAYTCYQNGAKILCNHDGTSYATGLSAYIGHIWLEEDGKISYIDAVGTERRTKMGDKYGAPTWYPTWAEIPSSPGTQYAGHIWVGWLSGEDTYLVIISSDGVKYRIGVGYALSGDYQ